MPGWQRALLYILLKTKYLHTNERNFKTIHNTTRLNPFARSWFYNATAVRGALWWLRQSHSVNYANQHSPGGGTTLQTPLSPVSFGKSFMKIRSAVPENGCLIFLQTEKKQNKKQKKTEKNICKTYTIPPHRRLRKWWQKYFVAYVMSHPALKR